MALNISKCNRLTPLRFKGLTDMLLVCLCDGDLSSDGEQLSVNLNSDMAAGLAVSLYIV